jgi:hypothetical protein
MSEPATVPDWSLKRDPVAALVSAIDRAPAIFPG